MTRRARTRSVVVLPVAAALLAAAGGTAYAVAQAQATGAQDVAVGTFGAQPATSASAAQAGPLTLAYANGDLPTKAFVVRSTGTLPLTAQSWTVSVSRGNNGNAGTDTVDVHTCPGGTYSAAGVCSAPLQEVYVGRATVGTPISAKSVALALGATPSTVNARVTAVAVGGGNVNVNGLSVTVSLSVARSQVRAATTSAS